MAIFTVLFISIFPFLDCIVYTDIHSVSPRIHSECRKIRSRKTLNRLFTQSYYNSSNDAVMTAHLSSIAEYGRVLISSNFILGPGITQYASKNSAWKNSGSFKLAGRNVSFGLINFIIFPFRYHDIVKTKILIQR